jgi:acetylornithine deacetylase
MCPSSVSDDVLERAVLHLVRLVDLDGTSGREGPVVDEMEAICRELGLDVRRSPVEAGRDNLLIGALEPRIVFCTHLDTVPPFIPATRDAEFVYGRGSADARGVAVAMLYALHRLQAAGHDDVACCFVVGEETDHSGAKAICHSGISPEVIVLGEPCGVTPVPAQKGLLKVRLITEGKAGHSAYPELGKSAIHELLHLLSDLMSPPFPSDDVLGETTLNVGLIEGGLAANVIAPRAEALLLLRCAAPVDSVLTEMRARIGDRAQIEELTRTEPRRFLTLGDDSTGGPEAVPFNTDAGTLAPLGAKMMLLGPGDMRCAHSPNERLAIEDLRAGIEAYASIARGLANN